MLVNIVLGTLIFGFAAWTIIRHIRQSSKGKCAACSMKSACECLRLAEELTNDCREKGRTPE